MLVKPTAVRRAGKVAGEWGEGAVGVDQAVEPAVFDFENEEVAAGL
jgi:hypothetical protein